MAYLELADYASAIKSDLLTKLTEGVDSNRTDAEARAISQARSRLASRYDTDAIFAKTGADRNPELVMCLVDMSLYHLHTRLAPGQVPEVRNTRYADALQWLEKVSAGDWVPDLPQVGDADGDGTDDRDIVQWGGGTPRDPYY